MDRIQTSGNRPLEGETAIQGSKNAALPLMSAAVLHEGITVLRHCPEITDVAYMTEILRELGCCVFREGGALVIDARQLGGCEVSARYATQLRASVTLMGSLLGRRGRVCIPYPGGCTIGARPIDLHLWVFRQMGAEITETADGICMTAQRLHGCELCFPFPSVGATENAVLGAVLAEGTTVLKGCASEPEITELCRFLQRQGADIRGIGSGELTVKGVDSLCGAEYRLASDRIVAGTYLLAAAGTRGRITLRGAPAEELETLLRVLEHTGAKFECGTDTVVMDAREAYRPVPFLETKPYPGFPTDLQSQMMAFLCRARGVSEIEETLFESRFLIAKELASMGADISVCGRRARIRGKEALYGACVRAQELRGGAALVAAGLAAEGKSVISGIGFIRRGYQDIVRDFRNLGADIHEIT